MGIFSRGLERPAPEKVEDADVLAMAIIGGHTKVVEDAIRRGIDLNCVGKAGTSALNLALGTKQKDIANLLIDAGANPNVTEPNYQMTALHLAVTNGYVDTVKRLIRANADVNARAAGGLSALGIAFRQPKPELVQLLLSHGADPNTPIEPPSASEDQRGITPLIFAASTGNLAIVEQFITAGADVERPKSDGLTPLVCAIFNGNLEIVKRLVAAGAKLRSVRDIDPIELSRKAGHAELAAYLSTLK